MEQQIDVCLSVFLSLSLSKINLKIIQNQAFYSWDNFCPESPWSDIYLFILLIYLFLFSYNCLHLIPNMVCNRQTNAPPPKKRCPIPNPWKLCISDYMAKEN